MAYESFSGHKTRTGTPNSYLCLMLQFSTLLWPHSPYVKALPLAYLSSYLPTTNNANLDQFTIRGFP